MFQLSQLQEMLTSVAAWAKSFPSEADGTGSSSRVIALSVTGTVLGLLIAYFHVKHDLPSPEQIIALGGILGTGTACYVANRLRKTTGDGDTQ